MPDLTRQMAVGWAWSPRYRAWSDWSVFCPWSLCSRNPQRRHSLTGDPTSLPQSNLCDRTTKNLKHKISVICFQQRSFSEFRQEKSCSSGLHFTKEQSSHRYLQSYKMIFKEQNWHCFSLPHPVWDNEVWLIWNIKTKTYFLCICFYFIWFLICKL